MISGLFAVLFFVSDSLCSRATLQAEVLALRHPILVLQRRNRKRRLKILPADRLLWVWHWRFWPGWRSALSIVKPETVIAWHRQGSRLYWSWKSRPRQGRPPVSTEVRALIRRMSTANPGWSAPGIHRELGKLGIPALEAIRRQVQGAAPSASLADLACLPEPSCETSRLGRETAAELGIPKVLCAPRSPWQNAYAERRIGSIRRECLGCAILFHESGLRRILRSYYYSRSRTPLSLDQDTPIPRAVHPAELKRVIGRREVNGLHHRYERRAA